MPYEPETYYVDPVPINPGDPVSLDIGDWLEAIGRTSFRAVEVQGRNYYSTGGGWGAWYDFEDEHHGGYGTELAEDRIVPSLGWQKPGELFKQGFIPRWRADIHRAISGSLGSDFSAINGGRVFVYLPAISTAMAERLEEFYTTREGGVSSSQYLDGGVNIFDQHGIHPPDIPTQVTDLTSFNGWRASMNSLLYLARVTPMQGNQYDEEDPKAWMVPAIRKSGMAAETYTGASPMPALNIEAWNAMLADPGEYVEDVPYATVQRSSRHSSWTAGDRAVVEWTVWIQASTAINASERYYDTNYPMGINPPFLVIPIGFRVGVESALIGWSNSGGTVFDWSPIGVSDSLGNNFDDLSDLPPTSPAKYYQWSKHEITEKEHWAQIAQYLDDLPEEPPLPPDNPTGYGETFQSIRMRYHTIWRDWSGLPTQGTAGVYYLNYKILPGNSGDVLLSGSLEADGRLRIEDGDGDAADQGTGGYLHVDGIADGAYVRIGGNHG